MIDEDLFCKRKGDTWSCHTHFGEEVEVDSVSFLPQGYLDVKLMDNGRIFINSKNFPCEIETHKGEKSLRCKVKS